MPNNFLEWTCRLNWSLSFHLKPLVVGYGPRSKAKLELGFGPFRFRQVPKVVFYHVYAHIFVFLCVHVYIYSLFQ